MSHAALAAAYALAHAPPLVAYLTSEFLEHDVYPKRLNACAVVKGVAQLCGNVDEPLEGFVEAVTKYAKAKGTLSVESALNKTLQACHEALCKGANVVDPKNLRNEAWNAFGEPSFIKEACCVQRRDKATGVYHHGYVVTVPVVGTSLAKCMRDAPWEFTRLPPILCLHLGVKTHYVDYTVDLSVHTSSYRLIAVICHAGAVLADDGPRGWMKYVDSKRTAVIDMNALITKEASVLLYKRMTE